MTIQAGSGVTAPGAITRDLAAYAVGASHAALPERVRRETVRAFLNWLGCVLGGCPEAAVGIAASVVAETGASPRASVIGLGFRGDIAGAAFVNCFSSSVLAFDDTHLATVTHPTGPVAAAILAFSETRPITGADFVTALALGIEIGCRMSNVLLLPPAQANLALYVTGLTGPIGAAAALGRLLGLDEERMVWALSLAAAQASGFRATHGAMAGLMVPAWGARNGVHAALLAAKGLTSMADTLESDRGFVASFSRGANLDLATDGLGTHFELLANAYKPYPCGIVIHAALDACLDLAKQIRPRQTPERIAVTVPPITVTLTDRPVPTNPVEAMVSIQHWAAAALLRGCAGLAELEQASIDAPDIARLRANVTLVADASLRRDEAIAEVTLPGGQVLRAHVRHARGSAERPMSDADLDAKFRMQARRVLSEARADVLLAHCRGIEALSDVGATLRDLMSEHRAN